MKSSDDVGVGAVGGSGAGLAQHTKVVYMGPFVCDLRILPLKCAIQFMLRKVNNIRNKHPSTHSNISSAVSASVHVVGVTDLLNKLVDLVNELCPELLLPDRSQCFSRLYNTSSYTLSHTSPHTLSHTSPLTLLHSSSSNGSKINDKIIDKNIDRIIDKMSSGRRDSVQSAIVEALLNLLMPLSESDVKLSDYIICCNLISSLHVSVLSSKTVLNKLMGHILQRAFLFDQNSQESSGLWRVWGA